MAWWPTGRTLACVGAPREAGLGDLAVLNATVAPVPLAGDDLKVVVVIKVDFGRG